jgi:hypothetical protein
MDQNIAATLIKSFFMCNSFFDSQAHVKGNNQRKDVEHAHFD